MNHEVALAIEELKRAFPNSELAVSADGQGGARVIVESVDLSRRFAPRTTWMGGHLTPAYPLADIYPVFIGADVSRVDGKAFEVPVTPNATFEGRPAWQVSRVNNKLHLGKQTAVSKFNKILLFLEQLP